jgi:hypothetical protein
VGGNCAYPLKKNKKHIDICDSQEGIGHGQEPVGQGKGNQRDGNCNIDCI